MRLGFVNKKKQFTSCAISRFLCLRHCAIVFATGVLTLAVTNTFAQTQAEEENKNIDVSKIEFPTDKPANAIRNLGVTVQRHENGRIKTYFQAGKAWRIGMNALSLSNHDFSEGAYAAEDGVRVTMLDEGGKQLFWVNADKACVYLGEKVGKCFGFVKLESPEVEMVGTNLVWNTTSTNLFTIENKVTLRIKNLDSNGLKGKTK